jgi:hypothetical protein
MRERTQRNRSNNRRERERSRVAGGFTYRDTALHHPRLALFLARRELSKRRANDCTERSGRRSSWLVGCAEAGEGGREPKERFFYPRGQGARARGCIGRAIAASVGVGDKGRSEKLGHARPSRGAVWWWERKGKDAGAGRAALEKEVSDGWTQLRPQCSRARGGLLLLASGVERESTRKATCRERPGISGERVCVLQWWRGDGTCTTGRGCAGLDCCSVQ